MSREPEPIGEFTTPYKWTKKDPVWIPEISDQHRIRYDKLKADLKVEESAHRDGALNEPASDEKVLNEPQARIQERIYSGVRLLNEFLAEQLSTASQNMVGDERRLDSDRRFREVNAEVDQMLAADAQLIDSKEAAVAAERNFRFFRARNALRRQPDYRESTLLFWAMLFGLLVLESLANGYVFQGVNPGGLSGGILLAMGISAVNITLGLIGGMVGWRLLGHYTKRGRALGLVVTVATLCIALVWNLYVAHYRQVAENALHELNRKTSTAVPSLNDESTVTAGSSPVSNTALGDELFDQARQSFIAHPLDLTALMAWILFGVGLLVFVVACREAWEDLADRYWGYRKVHWTSRLKREDFELACEEIQSEVAEYLDDAILEFRNRAALAAQGVVKSHAIADLAEQRLSEVRASEASWVSEGNRLLKLYRDENDGVRDKAAGVPLYWGLYPEVDVYRNGRFSATADPSQASKNYELGEALITEIRAKAESLSAISQHNKTALAGFEDQVYALKSAMPARLAQLRTEVADEADRRLGPDDLAGQSA